MKRIAWTTLGGLLLSLCAVAQDYAALDQAKKTLTDAIREALLAQFAGAERSVLAAPVAGAPYSADEVTTFTQTLADGTHIQREDKVTVYRDSQGRVRRETPNQITIADPVTGVAYSLDPNKLTARRLMVLESNLLVVPRNAITARSEPAAAAAGAPRTTFSLVGRISEANTSVFGDDRADVATNSAGRQSLGARSIEGVLSDGTGTTETLAAGSIGNDRPIQVVDERWYSSELKTTTMTRRSDPRTGEQVFRLANIRRGEPSPDLFQLPAGYHVTAN